MDFNKVVLLFEFVLISKIMFLLKMILRKFNFSVIPVKIFILLIN